MATNGNTIRNNPRRKRMFETFTRVSYKTTFVRPGSALIILRIYQVAGEQRNGLDVYIFLQQMTFVTCARKESFSYYGIITQSIFYFLNTLLLISTFSFRNDFT